MQDQQGVRNAKVITATSKIRAEHIRSEIISWTLVLALVVGIILGFIVVTTSYIINQSFRDTILQIIGSNLLNAILWLFAYLKIYKPSKK